MYLVEFNDENLQKHEKNSSQNVGGSENAPVAVPPGTGRISRKGVGSLDVHKRNDSIKSNLCVNTIATEPPAWSDIGQIQFRDPKGNLFFLKNREPNFPF